MWAPTLIGYLIFMPPVEVSTYCAKSKSSLNEASWVPFNFNNKFYIKKYRKQYVKAYAQGMQSFFVNCNTWSVCLWSRTNCIVCIIINDGSLSLSQNIHTIFNWLITNAYTTRDNYIMMYWVQTLTFSFLIYKKISLPMYRSASLDWYYLIEQSLCSEVL